MPRTRALRSTLATLAVLAAGVLGWAFAGPTQLGGATSYVTTHGTSMAPRFHTGDLALVRPEERYRVGQVVAYRSALLRTVVLHRIVARRGDRFVTKGDNNHFTDPEHPAPADIIGSLRLRVPHGGRLLGWLHGPGLALLAAAAVLLLFAAPRPRRRRRRATAGPSLRQGAAPMTDRLLRALRRADPTTVLGALGLAALACAGLALLAFTRPATRQVSEQARYASHARFSYGADVEASAVYPGGAVRTGDPIFLRLVPEVRVGFDYRFEAAAPRRLAGTQRIAVRLASATGWSRTTTVTGATRFGGDRAHGSVTLDLGALRALAARVERLTGAPAGGPYTVVVAPQVRLSGRLAGQPLRTSFSPTLSFQLDGLQLRLGGDGQAKHDGLASTRSGTVAVPASAPNRLAVRGHGITVGAARWLALLGLLLCGAAGLVVRRWAPRLGDGTGAGIRARYARLIVPVAGVAPDAARPAVDVTSIAALAQLAERSERPILHHRGADGADTYVVDDDGMLYRYRERPAAAA